MVTGTKWEQKCIYRAKWKRAGGGLSPPRKWSRHIFSYFFCQVQQKFLGFIDKTNKRIWKVERRLASQGTSGPKDVWHPHRCHHPAGWPQTPHGTWWMPWVFFFPSYIPDIKLKNQAIERHQWAQTKERSNKTLLSLVKEPRKRQSRKRESF